ncbi:MAG: anti-sigma factor [Chloroflexota bacterium]|nr:anti-sigma factor [Chloroflexota bacterium]
MNEKMEELLTFYALNVVTDAERQQVEAYVAADPEARLRLDEMLRTASALAYASEPMDPPPALKRTLMDRVNADAEKRFAPQAPIRTSVWSRFIESIVPRAGNLFPQAVTAFSLFIALAVGVWGLSLRNELKSLQAQTAQLQEEVAQQQALLSVLASPNAQTFVVLGTEHQPDSHGRLIVDSETGSAVLVVGGLQQLEAGKTYEFWLIDGDTPAVAAGLFEVNEEGRAILKVSQAVTPGSYDAVGVSVEPQGGSEQPTGDIVMLSEIN